MHICRLFHVLYNFFFGAEGGGGGGGAAIYALAVSIQVKCYLSPSHLHQRYFLVSRALARNLLYLGLPLLTCQATAMQAVSVFEICFLLVIVKLYVYIVG